VSSRSVKALLVILALLVGVIAGFVAGILSHLSGSPWPTAIRDGGGAFAVTVTLVILIMGALGLL
jgi:hypothetical protein